MKGLLIIYKEARTQFLKDNSVCEAGFDGCKVKATDLHHAGGRGKLLNDKSLWVALCRPCHNRVTEHSAEAIELGLSVRRNT